MKKTLLALTLGSAFLSASSVSAADATFYGRAWLGITNSDSGLLSNRQENGTQLENFASYLGVKGEEQLNDKFTLLYMMEVGNDGGYYDSSELFKPRNTYIGLKSNYGTAIFGRNDTVFKKTEGSVDLFNVTSADMAKIITGNDRLGDTATYYSPKFAGIQFGATYQFDDNAADSDGNYALSLTAGDAKLKKQNYYLALAHADGLSNLDAERAVAGVKFAGIQWGALYQHSESTQYDNLNGNSYMLSAALPLDQYLLKLQYLRDNSGLGKVTLNQANKATVTDADSYLWSLGLDYQASKATTLGVIASYLSGDYTDKTGFNEYDDTQFTVYLKQLF